MRWEEYVAWMGEIKNAKKMLVRKTQGKRSPGRQRV
jgi:hypothetical protein